MLKIYKIALCIAVLPQVFSATLAERRKSFEQPATAPAHALDGKRDANAVLGKSVKTAEATTTQVFTEHYTAAAHDATHAKRQQVNLWRIKSFQATHTSSAYFDASTTGAKAKPEHFQPTLDAANIAMAAAYALYNNCSRVSKEDVQTFAAKFPHEVVGLNLASLEGDLLPPNAAGQAFAYNPFSYGTVLVYRLRHADKLGGQAPTAIDVYNKEQAFAWEKDAGFAHESVGTGTAHTAPAVVAHHEKAAHPAGPAVTQAELETARTRLKHHDAPAHPVAAAAG